MVMADERFEQALEQERQMREKINAAEAPLAEMIDRYQTVYIENRRGAEQ